MGDGHKIIKGLQEAIAFVRGEEVGARVEVCCVSRRAVLNCEPSGGSEEGPSHGNAPDVQNGFKPRATKENRDE